MGLARKAKHQTSQIYPFEVICILCCAKTHITDAVIHIIAINKNKNAPFFLHFIAIFYLYPHIAYTHILQDRQPKGEAVVALRALKIPKDV